MTEPQTAPELLSGMSASAICQIRHGIYRRPHPGSSVTMNTTFLQHISTQIGSIRAAGTYKRERVLSTPQGTLVRANGGKPVLNLCANNYLGLANHRAQEVEPGDGQTVLDRRDDVVVTEMHEGVMR